MEEVRASYLEQTEPKFIRHCKMVPENFLFTIVGGENYWGARSIKEHFTTMRIKDMGLTARILAHFLSFAQES